MNIWILPLGLLCGLTLASAGVCVFALWRAHHLLKEVEQRGGAAQPQQSGEIGELRQSVERLAAQLRDLEKFPPVAPEPGLPRPGLNLSKRQQALRMHRKGDQPEQIASSLELPRQEVELLLQIQRIVLANV